MSDRDTDNFPGDDALDEVLARAAFPPVDPAAVGRLTRRWEDLRARQRRRGHPWWWAGGAAVAACVATAVGIWATAHREPNPSIVIAPPHDVPAARDVPVPHDARPPAVVVREPTQWERLLAASATAAPPRRERSPASAVPPDARELIAQLHAPRVSDREAAARELGAMNDPAVSRTLIRLAGQGRLRREAVMALAESREPTARAYIATVKRQGRITGAVARALAAKNDGGQM